jgi:hypothetical protein
VKHFRRLLCAGVGSSGSKWWPRFLVGLVDLSVGFWEACVTLDSGHVSGTWLLRSPSGVVDLSFAAGDGESILCGG